MQLSTQKPDRQPETDVLVNNLGIGRPCAHHVSLEGQRRACSLVLLEKTVELQEGFGHDPMALKDAHLDGLIAEGSRDDLKAGESLTHAQLMPGNRSVAVAGARG